MTRILRTSPAKARGEAIKKETGRRSVNTSAYGSETTQDEQLDARTFGPGIEPAFVRVSAGKTLNLGNYESLRIDVAVTLPCMPDAIKETYLDASGFVAESIAAEEQQWLGSTPPKPKATRGR